MLTIQRTTDGILVAEAGILRAITWACTTAGTGINVYDGTDTSGTIISTLIAVTNTTAVLVFPDRSMSFNTGLYVDLLGAAAGTITVYYETW